MTELKNDYLSCRILNCRKTGNTELEEETIQLHIESMVKEYAKRNNRGIH